MARAFAALAIFFAYMLTIKAKPWLIILILWQDKKYDVGRDIGM